MKWMSRENTQKVYDKLREYLPRLLFTLALGIYLGISFGKENGKNTFLMSLTIFGIVYSIINIFNWLSKKVKSRAWSFLILMASLLIVPFLLLQLGRLRPVSPKLYDILYVVILVVIPMAMPLMDTAMVIWFYMTLIHFTKLRKAQGLDTEAEAEDEEAEDDNAAEESGEAEDGDAEGGSAAEEADGAEKSAEAGESPEAENDAAAGEDPEAESDAAAEAVDAAETADTPKKE